MPFRKSIFFSAILFGLSLSGCGGGGGGDSSSSAPPQSSAPTFPVAQAYSQMLINGIERNMTVTVVTPVSTYNTSGHYELQPAQARTFEGQSAMAVDKVVYFSNQSGTGSLVTSTADFFDSNYRYLGSKDFDYIVMNQVKSLPTNVRAGDSGSLGSATGYSDQLKSSVSSAITRDYTAQEDTDSSVIFVITEKVNVNGQLTNTIIYRYRITDAAISTLLTVDSVSSTGDELHFTMQ